MKVIYNVTICIDSDVEQDWLNWMREEHVPEVLTAGKFLHARISRMLADEEESGVTYSIQYTAPNMEAYMRYVESHSVALQQKHIARFDGKFVAFRTLMEETATWGE